MVHFKVSVNDLSTIFPRNTGSNIILHLGA